jgi:hypothetical protein
MFIDDVLYAKKLEKSLKTLEEKVHEMLLNERETFVKVYQNILQSLKEIEDELLIAIKQIRKEKFDLKKSTIKK